MWVLSTDKQVVVPPLEMVLFSIFHKRRLIIRSRRHERSRNTRDECFPIRADFGEREIFWERDELRQDLFLRYYRRDPVRLSENATGDSHPLKLCATWDYDGIFGETRASSYPRDDGESHEVSQVILGLRMVQPKNSLRSQ